MKHLFLIAVAGALGAVLRYLVSIATHGALGRDSPYGTLAVNGLDRLLAYLHDEARVRGGTTVYRGI